MKINFKIHEGIKEIIPYNPNEDNLLFLMNSDKMAYDEMQAMANVFKTLEIKKKIIFIPSSSCFSLPDGAINQIMDILEKYKRKTLKFKD